MYNFSDCELQKKYRKKKRSSDEVADAIISKHRKIKELQHFENIKVGDFYRVKIENAGTFEIKILRVDDEKCTAFIISAPKKLEELTLTVRKFFLDELCKRKKIY